MNSLLHTPEGVRDIYNEECARKLFVENKVHNVVKSYGFDDVQAPTFEYFDIFNKERGSVASKEMFKFFDREGNTLVLRPDMTPQIARIAAKYFGQEDNPIKLCYKAKKFINCSSYQGRLKETTEVGAELIGDSSIDSDAEVIVLLVESLLASGLTEFQVEIGHINYFRGLVKEAGLDREAEDEILEMIKNKNYFGLEELIDQNGIEKSLGEAFLQLPQMFGSIDILDKAYALTTNETAREAISHLKELYEILKVYGVEKYVTFDLGMLNKLRYYTGIMFQAFTYGTGEYIASGGRYDKLMRQFGEDKPAIGFSITVDYLLVALNRQKIELVTERKPRYMILFNADSRNVAIKLAKSYREQNINVNMMLHDSAKNREEYVEVAKSQKVTQLIFVLNGDDIETIQI